ncbi:MAG: hypothetical protein ABIV07_11020, partial [Polaromonas sp.]
MRKIVCHITLLCGFPALQAADLPSPAAGAPALHPLTGNWAWTLPGKQCSETLRYRADGTRSGSSGEEVTQGRYEISAMPSLLGFYRLAETVTQSNDKPDCAGDVHPANGEPVTRFIQFSPRRDQFIVCKEEELKACFGPL